MTINSFYNLTKLLCVASLLFVSCDSKKSTENPPVSENKNEQSGGEYFSYSVDGKDFTVASDDVSTSFYPDATFKIFAGKDQEQSIVLTVPNLPNCPCSVPSGDVAGSKIDMGSVSLQNYPKRPIGFNSYYATDGDDRTPVPGAVTITDLGTPDKGYRLITGTFNVTVLKTATNGDDPANTDHVLKGKFRIKHDMKGSDKF